MDEKKCVKCSMPIEDGKTKCECCEEGDEKCIHCCECDEGCECKCKEKAEGSVKPEDEEGETEEVKPVVEEETEDIEDKPAADEAKTDEEKPEEPASAL